MSRKYKKHTTEHDIGELIACAADEVHRFLGGPGLLTCVYEEALMYELQERGMMVQRQMVVPLVYKGRQLVTALRIGVVGGKVLVHSVATKENPASIGDEALTYLRLLDLPLAVLVNFGASRVADGIRRIENEAATRAPLPDTVTLERFSKSLSSFRMRAME